MQATQGTDPRWSGGDSLAAGERLPVVVGAIVAGKYRVDQILGMGGMAIVAAATHLELGQRVALKVMRQPRVDPENVARFLTEARAAVSLKSHHVAKVLDVGALPSGLPYMVMELLVGRDFATILEQEHVLRPDVAIAYMLQACDAIVEAHRLGIIHRDLKPENIFLTQEHDGKPLVKVLDFGISKITTPINIQVTDSSRRTVTHESTLMGSPMYMSPEQIRSAKDVDARADVWSLGAILYELLTGHRAFSAENVADIFVKVLEKPAPSIDAHLRNAPPGLSEVIATCLEKDRKKRWQSVEVLAKALAAIDLSQTQASSLATSSYSEGARESRATTSSTLFPVHASTHAETIVLPGRGSSKGAVFRILALLSIVVIGVCLAFAVYHRRHRVVEAAAVAPPPPTITLSSAPPAASSSATQNTDPSPARPLAATTPTASHASRSHQKNNSSVSSVSSVTTSESDPQPAPVPAPTPTTTASAKHQRTEW